jgi:hypothetical protein
MPVVQVLLAATCSGHRYNTLQRTRHTRRPPLSACLPYLDCQALGLHTASPLHVDVTMSVQLGTLLTSQHKPGHQ